MPLEMQASNLLISKNQKIGDEKRLDSFRSKSSQNKNEEMNTENKRETKLSYDPPPEELPLFQSLFQSASKTKDGDIISIDEALEVLLSSGLSCEQLKLIFKMVKGDQSSSLTRNEFFVAVRLIQFRQNKAVVTNLTLTVPSNIVLKPPFFKVTNESILFKEKNVQNVEKIQCTKPAKLSTAFFQEKCLEMHKEIIELKQKLQLTVDELHEVKRDNFILRKSASQIMINESSSKMISQHSDSKIMKSVRKNKISRSHSDSKPLSASNHTNEKAKVNEETESMYIEFETIVDPRQSYQKELSLISDITEDSNRRKGEKKSIALDESEESLKLMFSNKKLKNIYRDKKKIFKL